MHLPPLGKTGVLGEKMFSRRLGKSVASMQTAIELKTNTLETNFLHKKSARTLPLLGMGINTLRTGVQYIRTSISA